MNYDRSYLNKYLVINATELAGLSIFGIQFPQTINMTDQGQRQKLCDLRKKCEAILLGIHYPSNHAKLEFGVDTNTGALLGFTIYKPMDNPPKGWGYSPNFETFFREGLSPEDKAKYDSNRIFGFENILKLMQNEYNSTHYPEFNKEWGELAS